jgi:hypothetical protein
VPAPENLQEDCAIVVVVDEVVVDEVVVDSSALATPAPLLPRTRITARPSRTFFVVIVSATP